VRRRSRERRAAHLHSAARAPQRVRQSDLAQQSRRGAGGEQADGEGCGLEAEAQRGAPDEAGAQHAARVSRDGARGVRLRAVAGAGQQLHARGEGGGVGAQRNDIRLQHLDQHLAAGGASTFRYRRSSQV